MSFWKAVHPAFLEEVPHNENLSKFSVSDNGQCIDWYTAYIKDYYRKYKYSKNHPVSYHLLSKNCKSVLLQNSLSFILKWKNLLKKQAFYAIVEHGYEQYLKFAKLHIYKLYETLELEIKKCYH